MDATETPIYHAVIACGIVILIFTIVFVSNSIWLQRKFQAKRRLRIEAEVVSMEKERTRIAADLHDEAGPLIYSVKRKIEDALLGDENSSRLLNEGQQHLRMLSEQLHAISKAMIPLSLERKGLLYSLQELVLEKSIENDIEIQLQCSTLPVLSKNAQTHIYRIVQEIIHNTVKHAAASKLIIEFERESHQLYLRTSDNGKGFDVERLRSLPGGLGIGNIQMRALFLNGSAIVRSVNGCQWEIKLTPQSD